MGDERYFLIEKQVNGEWKRVWTYDSLQDAVNRFRRELLADAYTIVRITSPTDTSIYD